MHNVKHTGVTFLLRGPGGHLARIHHQQLKRQLFLPLHSAISRRRRSNYQHLLDGSDVRIRSTSEIIYRKISGS
jgi:hypothetical protein